MVNYLLKTLVLVIFSLIISYFYYLNPAHIENFDWYLSYIIIIWIIYWIYKFFQFEFSDEKVSFSLFKILNLFLIHLFVLCVLFFSYSWLELSNGIILFFKIIYFSILPIFIILTSLAFWTKIVSYLEFVKNENIIYKFIISIWVWFFSFVYLLDIIWILWFYNLYIVFLILAWFIAFSYKEFKSVISWIFDYKIEFDIEEWKYFRLISTEFLFLISTFLLSVNLISIVRPFPIWWDDLWVYMNYPQLMAESGSIISLWSMYAWETFTGIGYMFWNPTQAFFLNNVWWFMSFILLVLITSDLINLPLKTKLANIPWKISNKKTFLNIPMLIWTMFISMPMIVFQQAKDMKLDSWLFFVSIIAVYLLFKYYIKLDNESYLEKIKSFLGDKILHKSFNLNNLVIIFIIWILAGFAFSIKITSLLLILSIIWVIFFVRFWIFWFLGYIFVFFAIFTKANLWKMMNVLINPQNIPLFENKIFLFTWLIGWLLLSYSFFKNKWVIKKFFIELSILLLGIILALLPWIWKNIYDSYPEITLSRIISGKPDSFNVDFTKIHSEDDLEKIRSEIQSTSIWSEWTTINEDFWRYFGYEKWVNNYIKLPWTLTMQINQWWEFTDIWFLFLALLPAILLFLPYRKKYYSLFIVLILIIELSVFIKTDKNIINNSELSIYSQMSKEAKNVIFQKNDNVFLKKNFNKNVYDIDVWNYITKSDIESLGVEKNNYKDIEKKVIESFYTEIKSKLWNKEIWKSLELIKKDLNDKDFKLINELKNLNINFSTFNNNILSILDLEELIKKYDLAEYREPLLQLWKDNRTINQSITDFLSIYNLPTGYLIVFLVFFLPTIILLYIIDLNGSEKQKLYLFKLNLIFAVFYTFLWNISSFWVVWYGIVMYFSFLITLAIWLYYLTSYDDEKKEKEFYIKLFWSLMFSIIVIIYIWNSIIPHSFINLKNAWYQDYKIWKVSTIDAPYRYNKENLKILFYLNIDQNKKEDFLKKYIKEDIIKVVNGMEKMDIYLIENILKELLQKENLLSISAKISLNNLYKNISNPPDEFKNKSWIYRIGTFLKYHISENNIRLFEDSLLFTFNDFIYNVDLDKTVQNLKKLWVDYLLIDLNAATIDKDERRNLTKRYERLLKTFTSKDLELVETDSICLKVALEDFNKSEKNDSDKSNFITIAGVNYESYKEDWTQINRNTKLLECFKRVKDLVDNWKIDTNNYSYLLNLNNYLMENKAILTNDQQIYPFLQQRITHWFKVLFKIK